MKQSKNEPPLLRHLRESFGMEPVVAQGVLEAFLSSYVGLKQTALTSMANLDMQLLAKTVHTLKSSVSYFSLSLHSEIKNLEDELATDQPQFKRVNEVLKKIDILGVEIHHALEFIKLGSR